MSLSLDGPVLVLPWRISYILCSAASRSISALSVWATALSIVSCETVMRVRMKYFSRTIFEYDSTFEVVGTL